MTAPFHPVIALVAQGLAFTATDTAAEKVEKIARGLRELATPESVALLADFLGLAPPTPLALNPDVRRRKTMELLAHWNLALSAAQPLVLLVEDLHCGAAPRRWSCSGASSRRAPRRACSRDPVSTRRARAG
jgi:hypothetical protein